MKRTKPPVVQCPTAILTGDWHLREDQPLCRTDDFQKKQWEKVDFIASLQRQHNCPVIHSGDLFDHWKPSPYLLSMAIERLPKEFYTVYGNHDLPQHSLELAHKCGVNTLVKAGRIQLLQNTHWGKTPEKDDASLLINSQYILVWHVMTYSGKSPWPGCTDPQAMKILRDYPYMNLIVTGHNHQSFALEDDGRWLVNPGMITRQEADQADFRPRVYLWCSETNTVKPVYLPIDEGVVTRKHIDQHEQRDSRIEAFISRLSDEWKVGLSFEENLERFASNNQIRESVMQIVRQAVDEQFSGEP